MKRLRLLVMALLCVGVSACGFGDAASRDAPLDSRLELPELPVMLRNYALQDTIVTVPRDLRVSERNGFYPLVDIVWRGDPIGDRYAQIGGMFDTAANRTAAQLSGDRPVVALITLERFHGVTERTRYTVGGVYHVVFILTVADARTGAIVEPPRRIDVSLPAPGGQAAVQLDNVGQTERVRMTDFLNFVLRRELGGDTTPGAPEPIADLI